MKILKNSKGSGMALSYVYNILNMLCGIFISSFVIRTIGKTEYGIYQTISSFTSYLILLEFGTGTIMTKNIAACRARKASREELERNVSTIMTATHILALAIITFSVGFYFFIDSIYSNSLTVDQLVYAKKIFIFSVGHLVISFYSQTFNGLILGFEEYRFNSIKNIARVSLRTLILVALLIFFKFSIIIAIVDFVLILLILVVQIFYSTKKFGISLTGNIKKFDKAILKYELPLCFAIFLQTIVNQANNNVDKFIISIKLSPEAVTFYSVALYIFTIASSLLNIPISIYSPEIVKKMSKDITRNELSEHLVEPCRFTSLIGGLILFGFIAAGKPFLSLIYGEEYVGAWTITIILMVPMFLNMVNGVIVNVLNVLNKRMVRSIALFATTVANIILTVFWIDIWGMEGAAWATFVCTMIGSVIVMNIYYQKFLKLRIIYIFAESFKGILPYQIIASIPGYFIGILIPNQFLALLASGTTFLLIFGVLYFLFGAKEKEKAKLKSMLHRG